MPNIAVIDKKCDRCMKCAGLCPFGAITIPAPGEAPRVNEGCRLCGVCVKGCPRGALMLLEAMRRVEDAGEWRGIMVFAEIEGGLPHPVTYELIGEALKLGEVGGGRITCVAVGKDLAGAAEEIRHYGADELILYDDEAFAGFRADAYAAALEDAVKLNKPSVVLVGATSLGRSLAPRVSTRFRTGLTADCTRLEMREDGNLVQIRPAFGGNIMAQIITPYTRPQFATVRYKVMQPAPRLGEPSGSVTWKSPPAGALKSRAVSVAARPLPRAANISEAEVLVVGGRGLKSAKDIEMLSELAALLGGELAVTRPLAERGWASNMRQIGLSGRTVRPKLIITCGVSGAIQFTAGMDKSERIVAINTDRSAPIFEVAHTGIVGDLYEVIPELMRAARRDK